MTKLFQFYILHIRNNSNALNSRLELEQHLMLERKSKNEFLSNLEVKQPSLFKNDFTGEKLETFVNMGFEKRGYTVNNKIDEIIDSKIQTVSFFSGAGGLDIGTQLAGSKVISSLDFDKDSVATMHNNNYFSHSKHLHKNIEETSALDYSTVIKDNNPEKLILIGGPPCQPFSKAGYWVTHKNRLGSEDPRNMIGQYLRMIDELSPDGFILENVESLLHPKNAQAVTELKEVIDKLNYKFIVYRANALDFGVPQKRKRVFFIASKKDIIGEPIKTHGSEKEIMLYSELKPYERVIDWIGKFDDDRYFEPEELTNGKTYDEELKQIPPGKNYFALTEKDGHPNPKFKANKRFWSFLLKLHPDLPSWTIAIQLVLLFRVFNLNIRRLRVYQIAI